MGRQNQQSDIELIVANSHLHGDHYAAWNQFVDRPNTIMVGLTHEEMMAFGELIIIHKRSLTMTWRP